MPELFLTYIQQGKIKVFGNQSIFMGEEQEFVFGKFSIKMIFQLLDAKGSKKHHTLVNQLLKSLKLKTIQNIN